jgi:hypothetical protein
MSEPHRKVTRAVLAQALGSVLQPGEVVACAVHAESSKGRMLYDAGGAQVAIATDRRLVQVNGWITVLKDFAGSELERDDEAMARWSSGRRLHKGRITRRYVWFGQIRDVGVDSRRSRLVRHTSDGERQSLKADVPSLLALSSAIWAGLDGPHGSALPPRHPPGNTGGWVQLFRQALRPGKRSN